MRTEERRAARRDKSNRYVDPATKKSVGDKSSMQKSGQLDQSGVAQSEERGDERHKFRTEAVPKSRATLRKSTKVASARAAEERERRRKGEEARRQLRAQREAERKPARVLTQEDRLAIARETEIENKQSLAELLKLEEKRKRTPVQKRQNPGPVLSVRVRDGKTTVSLSEGVDVMEAMFPQLTENENQNHGD